LEISDKSTFLNQKHEYISVDNEFLKDFHGNLKRTAFLSDGYSFANEALTLVFNQIAKRVSSIKISCKFGNILSGKLPYFKFTEPTLSLFDKHLYSYFTSAKTNFINDNIDRHPLSLALFEYSPSVESHKLGIEQSQLTVRNLFFDVSIASVLYRKHFSFKGHSKLADRLLADVTPKEMRLNIKPGPKRRFGTISFTHRSKKTYSRYFDDIACYALYKDWFQQRLSEYVAEILLDTKTRNRNIFNMKILEKTINSHRKRNRDHTDDIVTALSVELLYRTILD
jgi:hypothetical protein